MNRIATSNCTTLLKELLVEFIAQRCLFIQYASLWQQPSRWFRSGGRRSLIRRQKERWGIIAEDFISNLFGIGYLMNPHIRRRLIVVIPDSWCSLVDNRSWWLARQVWNSRGL
jgi:hypothetical protein